MSFSPLTTGTINLVGFVYVIPASRSSYISKHFCVWKTLFPFCNSITSVLQPFCFFITIDPWAMRSKFNNDIPFCFESPRVSHHMLFFQVWFAMRFSFANSGKGCVMNYYMGIAIWSHKQSFHCHILSLNNTSTLFPMFPWGDRLRILALLWFIYEFDLKEWP